MSSTSAPENPAGTSAAGTSAAGTSAAGRGAAGRGAGEGPARWRAAALAAAAVVLIVAGAGWWLVRPSSPAPHRPLAAASATPGAGSAANSGGGTAANPAGGTAAHSSDPAAGQTPADGPSTTIGLPGVQAKCREPEPARLAEAADFAVRGTVTEIRRGTVTLRVTKVFKGARFAEVRVAQTGDSSEQLMGGSGTFVTGKEYLVASAQGDVMICGYSGEVSEGLLALYDEAF